MSQVAVRSLRLAYPPTYAGRHSACLRLPRPATTSNLSKTPLSNQAVVRIDCVLTSSISSGEPRRGPSCVAASPISTWPIPSPTEIMPAQSCPPLVVNVAERGTLFKAAPHCEVLPTQLTTPPSTTTTPLRMGCDDAIVLLPQAPCHCQQTSPEKQSVVMIACAFARYQLQRLHSPRGSPHRLRHGHWSHPTGLGFIIYNTKFIILNTNSSISMEIALIPRVVAPSLSQKYSWRLICGADCNNILTTRSVERE